MDHEGLMISDNSSYIAVVAINFGTTYSGFAFAFNHKQGGGGFHMNKAWGNEQGLSTLKTSTSLLLRPDGQFDSFGFEADEKYANFFCGEDQEYMYFKRFKMTLHKSESLDRNAKLMASNGRKLEALTVFSHSIRYLKDKAIEIIREVTGDDMYNAMDIQWVLTVPAIWKPAAKQFMREAAYMAGVGSANNPEQLLIALEPEAASIHCRDKKMNDFTSERGDADVSDVFARPAAKYLVVDIGERARDRRIVEEFDRQESEHTPDFDCSVAVHDIVFKSGSPSPRVLHLVSSDVCAVWKSLGRQLRIPDSTLDQIEADNIKEGQYEQCYCMLTTWTEVQTDPPTYQKLGQALQHETVGRPDIAKKYCCESDDEESVEMSTGAPFKEGVLNQQEIHSLARKLKTWKRIGRALQLDDATLNEIDEDINGLVEKSHAMLRRWMEVNGSAATYQKLAEGLEIAKRRDLIRTVCCERI